VSALADRTWSTVSGDVLLVPVGALEQHGPHLPLSTDGDIARALAERAAAALPRALVAPVVAYGASGEHEGFPGTISIGREALALLLVELCRSASANFPRIVLVSAHGGNAEPVLDATTRLRSEGRDVIAWSPRWNGDAHAGRTETSIMLALDPARVDLARAEAGNLAPLRELLPGLVERGVRPVSANGILGDPAGASAEEGLRLLGGAVGDLLAVASS
jgi:creatinine amidohydrolase